jgi:DNA-binding NtrC family response regulator/Tfp pilus assembly protein PilF
MISRLRDLPVSDRYNRAELHFHRGMYALARQEFDTLLAAGDDEPVPWKAEVSWHLAVCCAALGKCDDADDAVERALEIPGISRTYVARLQAVQGFSALSRGEYALAREICQRTTRTLRDIGDHAGLTSSLRWLALTHLRLGELEPAFECGYCALAEARHAGVEAESGHAHALLCVAFIQNGQYDAAKRHGREALDIATRLGHQSGVVRNNIQLSIACRLSGELEAAAKHALRALAGAEESDAPMLAISARLAGGRALRETGRHDAARELVQGALKIAESSERSRDYVLVLEDLGDLDMAAGNVRAAVEKFRTAYRRAETIAAEGDLIAELGWRIGATLLELGDREGAIAWIERSLTVSEKAGERKEKALAFRARARWRARSGQLESARVDLDESLRILASLNVPYELARTHVAFDLVLSESGSDSAKVRAERREHLSVARRIFEQIGAAHDLAVTEEAEIRLTSEGGEPPSPRRSRGSRGQQSLEAKWASPAFRATLEECRKLGPTSLPLLLVGETGTGKTLLADALHHLGRREQGDFFPVNCAALPEHLQESELFGHRKGAFTGAEREHSGILREAGRGTVFLDEIDKSSLEFQAKLLDVLDVREVRPVGSTRRVPVEARIICATNRDLFALVEEGKFLEDLHHRLMCGIITVPALRERIEDLSLLCGALLEEIAKLENVESVTIADDAWRVLRSHAWPGNVRELKALLHRAVALNRGKVLDAAAVRASAPLGSTLQGSRSTRASVEADMDLARRMAHLEREEIRRALVEAGGVRRKAAEILGVSYRGLGKKMVRLGLADRERKRPV